MIYIGIVFIAILVSLAAYRIDQKQREVGKSNKSHEPWNWEGWL